MFLLLTIAFALSVSGLTLTPSIASANDQRPFWAERSSFTSDNELYAIGVATNAPSVEAGRQAAFEHGLDEIRNYGQIDTLNNLQVHTQMTFEEPQSDGRVSVWRLLRVSMGDLRVVKNSQATQVRQETRSTFEVPRVNSTDAPRVPAVTKVQAPKTPEAPKVAAANTRQTVTTQEVNLPAIPLRYPQVINGWTQDRHGRIGVAWQDRQEWYVPVLKASDLAYARSLLNPR
jgi:hypothetical protein